MARKQNKGLIIPCIAMVAVEFSTVIVTILFKAASLNYFVFIAYCYILGTLFFLLLASLFNRKTELPPLKFPLFSRIFILELIGFSSQLLFYKGLQLSSPTLASANSNLVPAFTFILAIFFRMEKVSFRSSSTQAKIIGTVTSILGALVIIFFKGPKVISYLTWSSSSSSSALLQLPLVLTSSESNWNIGGLLQVAAFVLISFGYIIQSQVMKIYPEEITVTLFCKLFGTIISLPVCILAEPNLSSWRISSSLPAVAVLYSGPVFVTCFKPTSIVIAVFMSVVFLGEALFLGSVIGTLIISTGLYCILWGKAKEEQQMIDDDSCLSTVDGRVPLLQIQ